MPMSFWLWFLLIIIAVTLVVVVCVHVYIYRCYHYICPKCAKTFKPSTFLRSMFALNGGEYRKVKCPYCSCHDWAKAEKDSAVQ